MAQEHPKQRAMKDYAQHFYEWLKNLSQHSRFILWSIATLIGIVTKLSPKRHNNFSVFFYSGRHYADLLPLYGPQLEHNDVYLYGPLFACLMLPFSYLPPTLVYVLWMIFLAAILFYALSELPIRSSAKNFIVLFSLNELITGLMMQQYNVAVGAMIILTFVCIEKQKETWAAFWIALGILTKVYGIVGLAFFPFCQRKGRFILALLGWLVVLGGVIPMLPHGFGYMAQQYEMWADALLHKDGVNATALMQNISLIGFIKKALLPGNYSDLWIIFPGLMGLALPFLRFSCYKSKIFRLQILSSILLFVVLFSTGSESSTYIICFPGIALWYICCSKRSKLDKGLMIGCFILSSLSPTDIFPSFLRHQYIIPLALKALFPALIWLKIQYELITGVYPPEPHDRKTTNHRVNA